MIVRNEEAQARSFLGIDFHLLARGERSMVTRMNYRDGDSAPAHAHPNEQSGYVVSGKIRMIFGDFDQVLGPGDSYSIPAGVEHRVEVIQGGEVLDFFVPPREDYL